MPTLESMWALRMSGARTLALALGVFLLVSSAHARGACHDTLRALLVGDIHDDIEAVEKLRSLMVAHGAMKDIDVILSPGDFTTAPCSRDPQVQRNYEAPTDRVIAALAAFGRPLYFVGGNHDPLSLFNRTAPRVDGTYNVHGRTVELAPGLRLLGWGGSSSAIENGVPVWQGWPFSEL